MDGKTLLERIASYVSKVTGFILGKLFTLVCWLAVLNIFTGNRYPLLQQTTNVLFCVLVGLFWVGLITYFVNHEKEARKRFDFVASFPFPEKAKGVLIRERPDLSPEIREQAWEALRQYFLLHAHQSGRFLGMPSGTADAAWHAFMLCTHEYEEFCQSAFGKFLHHVPDEKARPCTMGASFKFKNDVIATWKACKELKDAHPELALAAVPLLFSLDATAGSGWIHTPESRAALQSQALRQVTLSVDSSGGGSGCGSDGGAGCGGGGGCGGGCGGCGGCGG